MVVVSGFKEEEEDPSTTPLVWENFIYSACPHPRQSGLELKWEVHTAEKREPSGLQKNKYTFQGWVAFWELNSFFWCEAPSSWGHAGCISTLYFFHHNLSTHTCPAPAPAPPTPTLDKSDIWHIPPATWLGGHGDCRHQTPIWRSVISTEFGSHKNLNTC